jgi:ABC-type antimicrobial peptide transport system permease subunit
VCTALASLALLLTLTGVYGVLSYLVTQRSREIGVRVALGATTASVIGLILKQSLRYSLRGVLVGGALALVIAQLLASKLTIIDPFDLGAYGIGILTVIGSALAAAYVPSRRAARLDAATTLRAD